MPQSYYNASGSHGTAGLGVNQIANACPSPLTPPPEQYDQHETMQVRSDRHGRESGTPQSDNTAAGMAQSQEDSIYISPAASPEIAHGTLSYDKEDTTDLLGEEGIDNNKSPVVVDTYETRDESDKSTSGLPSPSSPEYFADAHCSQQEIQRSDIRPIKKHVQAAPNTSDTGSRLTQDNVSNNKTANCGAAGSHDLVPVDSLSSRSIDAKPWTFSKRRLLPEYPSHVFQSFSRYSGTQQSNRQIYNVDVTVLTVDMTQCTMTGYLLIKGLTPEHDTLQTYFTGEIIGGPSRHATEKQNYTFRTINPAWGASEKTDLTHWAQFPAWRSLSSHAKRNINFEYPTDGGNWWEQENIFMRWKEHFLVPDHKTKSIAGASFEGFYYICLNQVQGRISGIYYHSKSEKGQQLELKHGGKPEGLFNRGVTPCVEFR